MKFYNWAGFAQMCETWRNRQQFTEVYTDLYDGTVWRNFQIVNSRPFLQLPNSLGLILNVDWFNPVKHLEYSFGVIYLVIGNLPQPQRYIC